MMDGLHPVGKLPSQRVGHFTGAIRRLVVDGHDTEVPVPHDRPHHHQQVFSLVVRRDDDPGGVTTLLLIRVSPAASCASINSATGP